MSPLVQSLPQTQILILKILNVFLRLESSHSLTLNKIECFFVTVDQNIALSSRDPWGTFVPGVPGLFCSSSTFDIQKSYPFTVLYLITFLYCTLNGYR